METKLTCINCPLGCDLTVTYETLDPESITVTGNTCPRGKQYGIDEVTHPTRTVTGTIKVSNRENLVVPVKTKSPIPKDKIFEIVDIFKQISVEAPVHIGDIALTNIANTNVDLVITKNIE